VVIYGSRASGRPVVMQRLVNLMNSQYPATLNAGVYVDLAQVRPVVTSPGPDQVDGLYRSLVLAPVAWMRDDVGLPPDKTLSQLEADLRSQVNVPAAKLDALRIRQTFQVWLTKLGVDHLSLFIDEMSVMPPDQAPLLLRMLLDTFPRGGRVVFKLGGRKDLLRVGERTGRAGVVGLQLNHDILVGLDLDEILSTPAINTGAQAPLSDPKQIFLASCIRQIVPAVADQLQLGARPQWHILFDPPDSWNDLYRLCDGDVTLVGRSVESLLRQSSRFSLPLIERAVELARNDGRPAPRTSSPADLAPARVSAALPPDAPTESPHDR